MRAYVTEYGLLYTDTYVNKYFCKWPDPPIEHASQPTILIMHVRMTFEVQGSACIDGGLGNER